MNLSFDLTPRLQLLCKVCGQSMCGEEADDDKRLIWMIGARNFSECPCCGRAVFPPSSKYLIAAMRFVCNRLKDKGIRSRATGATGRIVWATRNFICVSTLQGERVVPTQKFDEEFEIIWKRAA